MKMRQVQKQRTKVSPPSDDAVDDWPEPVNTAALDASTMKTLDAVDQVLDL